MKKQYLASLLFVGLTASALVSARAQASVDVSCEETTTGEAGNGQRFDFLNRLELSFESATSASVRYYSEFNGNNQLEDGGNVTADGHRLPNNPNYVIYTGADHVEQGQISVAIPNGILNEAKGTRFKGYFQTVETDQGIAHPMKMNDDMNCVIQ